MRRVQRRRRLTLHSVRRARRWRRLTAVLLILVGSVLGAGVTFYVGLEWFQLRPPPGAADQPPVAVSWPAELDAAESASLLFDLGLTDHPSAMEVYFLATRAHECAQAGPHLLPKPATPQALVAALCRSATRPKVKVTIVEGFNRFAVAKRLETLGVSQRDAFLHVSADAELLYQLGIELGELPEATTAEGYLFPATYELMIDSDPSAVLRMLVAESDKRWASLIDKNLGGWERLQAELDMHRRDVINLAAMVEKEAAVAEERPLIASVFLNRLRSKDYPHLQSDPTAMYGCRAMPDKIPACRDWNGKASGAINRDKANAFSTYVTRGLPPGPIANPSMESIEAVLAPADTSFYFFVAKGKGRHEFTGSYDEHLQAVKRLRDGL